MKRSSSHAAVRHQGARPPLFILFAVASGLAGPAALAGQGGTPADRAPGRDWHAGLGLTVASMLSPYGDADCLYRRIRYEHPGLEARLAAPVGERSDVSLRLTAFLRPGPVSCPDISISYDQPLYPGEVTGRARTIELWLSTAPAIAPSLRAGVGGGWMPGVPTPFGTVSIGYRTAGRFPIGLDAGVRVASAPRVHMEGPESETGRDREWTAGVDVRLAVEAPFSPRQRDR